MSSCSSSHHIRRRNATSCLFNEKKMMGKENEKEKEKLNRIEYEKHFPFTLYALPCVLFAYYSLRILSLLNFCVHRKPDTRARLASSAFGIFSLFSVFFLSVFFFFTYFVSFLQSFGLENEATEKKWSICSTVGRLFECMCVCKSEGGTFLNSLPVSAGQ